MKQKEAEYADKYANADQQTIGNIKDNYERTEKGIVNELFFQVPHGGTIGNHREKIWGKMFENIVPRKFVIEQSVFIIDSYGKVSNEVDLAIFDETYTPYIFRYAQLKFIPIEAVACAIECKSTSMNKEKLMTWTSSIQSLKTSPKSFVRTIGNIACAEINPVKTQTATRPLRILCCLNEEAKMLIKENERCFDITIRARDGEDKLKIEWDDKKENLFDWYTSLNHAGGLSNCGENSGIKGEEEVKKYGLDNYLVHHKNSELTLLTFNFQLNQLLMLINNPMLFPHAAYAEMFDKNGNGKEIHNG
nr:DUF6602 domain-containing protein [uncultured Eisenbergiella sp.]